MPVSPAARTTDVQKHQESKSVAARMKYRIGKLAALSALSQGCLLAVLPANAVMPPSPYVTGYSYLAGGLVAGTISPAPSGSSNFLATRNTYDSNERLSKVEKGALAAWQSNTVLPASWTGFTVSTTTTYSYDANGNTVLQTLAGSDGVVTNVTQYSYDSYNRLTCTAIRMNPAVFGSLPASACTSSAQGTSGPDRITESFYDTLNRVTQIQRAVGTSLQENYATYAYTADSQKQYVTDANGNKSYFTYDGFDRLSYWYFPSPTSVGNYNASDYELYGYDPNGNRLSLRKRDGQVISYLYDALNRMYQQTEPVAANSVSYAYDLRGLQLSALFTSSGLGIHNGYDGFGRRTTTTSTMGGVTRVVSRQYDLDGDLVRVTHPDTNYFQYTYDGLDRFSAVLENGTTGIVGQTYFTDGLRSAQTRGGVTTNYVYQNNTLLSSITDNLTGTASVTTTFAYNPANQILTRMRTNDAYAYTGTGSGVSYAVNGLNQYTTVAGATFGYDGRGNLTSDGATTYGYDAENHLITASGAHTAALTYDPLGRLFQIVSGSNTTQFLYDGDALVAEYNGSGTLLNRYVHGPLVDNPMIWYQGATVTSSSRNSLQVDHQGSVVTVANAAGSAATLNTYDEYGTPGSTNAGRFQYTGQTWFAELGLHYYKARFYSPSLGRFLQTDPIGYQDDVDFYTYVGNDPLDKTDPTGQCDDPWCQSQADANTTPQGTAAMAWGIADSLSVGGATGIVPFGNANDPQVQAGYHAGTLVADAITVGAVGVAAAGEAAAATPKTVVIDSAKYPESAAHVTDAQAAGKPSVLTVDRAGAAARRQDAMKGTKPTAGKHRDEYPPAMFKEGGAGASVRSINPSDNTGSGSSMGHQCSSVKDGDQVRIVCK